MVSELEQKLLAIMIAVIMLGMGSSLTWKDFFLSLKKPQGILIGFTSQFGFMPLIALGLALLLKLSPEQAIGLILIGCTPGGTTSNIFTYFSKGNLALSVLMTINSTLFAVLMMPLLIYLYGGIFATPEMQIPFKNIAATLIILLIPVAIGMVVRKLNANIGGILEMMGSLLGVLVIVFLIVTWVPKNSGLLAITPWQIYVAAVSLGLCGMVFGYRFAKALKLHPRNCRTVALETGIQNGPLTIGIVILSFAEPQMSAVLLIPVLYSLFIVISSTFVTFYFRKINDAAEQKIPDLL